MTRTTIAILAVLAVTSGCTGADITIDVEVVDDLGNPLANDPDIRVDCESNTLTVTNMALDDEGRFQCSTLNEGHLISYNRHINFVIRDEAGRFATFGEAAILEEGETRSYSIQLERE